MECHWASRRLAFPGAIHRGFIPHFIYSSWFSSLARPSSSPNDNDATSRPVARCPLPQLTPDHPGGGPAGQETAQRDQADSEAGKAQARKGCEACRRRPCPWPPRQTPGRRLRLGAQHRRRRGQAPGQGAGQADAHGSGS